ncbi:MAG: hypothetical protein ACYSW8_26550 [Planctomycetota bacterium]|jgi:hypothetical protein
MPKPKPYRRSKTNQLLDKLMSGAGEAGAAAGRKAVAKAGAAKRKETIRQAKITKATAGKRTRRT